MTSETAPTTSSASDIVKTLRHTFESGTTRPLEWRKQQLNALLTMLSDHEEVFADALNSALGKSPFGGYDLNQLKDSLERMLGGAEKYTVTGTSKASVTADVPLAGGKKTAAIKTVKGTRPGEWLVDAVEVK